MNKVLISIGSNENRDTNIFNCRLLLEKHFEQISYSCTLVTKPYGAHYKNDFLNQLAFVNTSMALPEVSLLLKSIEKEMGRLPSHKAEGLVIIDVDLIAWNNEIIKPEDLERSYIAELLPINYFYDSSRQPIN